MRILVTASGKKKLKLARTEWASIGDKAGWIKISRKKEIIFLIGPPAIGKSTWVSKNKPDSFVISRDDVVSKVASEIGFNYDDIFKSPDQNLPLGYLDSKYGEVVLKPENYPDFLPEKLWSNVIKANEEVREKFEEKFEEAVNSGQDIVVDMTNMDAQSRAYTMKMFGANISNYNVKAVNFNFDGDEVKESIKEISKKRHEEIKNKGGSKKIPDAAFQRMFDSYEPPTKEEGFNEILNIDDRQRLFEINKN